MTSDGRAVVLAGDPPDATHGEDEHRDGQGRTTGNGLEGDPEQDQRSITGCRCPPSAIAARPASSRATGTRNGEQET